MKTQLAFGFVSLFVFWQASAALTVTRMDGAVDTNVTVNAEKVEGAVITRPYVQFSNGDIALIDLYNQELSKQVCRELNLVPADFGPARSSEWNGFFSLVDYERADGEVYKVRGGISPFEYQVNSENEVVEYIYCDQMSEGE